MKGVLGVLFSALTSLSDSSTKWRLHTGQTVDVLFVVIPSVRLTYLFQNKGGTPGLQRVPGSIPDADKRWKVFLVLVGGARAALLGNP